MTTNTTTDLTARQALDQWLTMWNGDGDLARSLCADDFRIHFAVTEPDGSTPADDIRSAEDFARYLQWWHGQHPGVVFTSVADAVDGPTAGCCGTCRPVTCSWVGWTCSTSPRTVASAGSGPWAGSAACGAEGWRDSWQAGRVKRAERQYALVDLLRAARRPVSAARLAREFGVSTRTVERDIASLQVAGVPLYADHGVAGGYSILREYSLPP